MAGNRYGRRQKRETRKRIAELEARIDVAEKTARIAHDALQRQKEELRRVVAEIKSVAEYSAILPPRRVTGQVSGRHPDESYRIPLRKQFAYWVGDLSAAPVSIETVDLNEVRAAIQRDEMSFQRVAHLIVEDQRTGAYSYRVSEEAWRHMVRDRGLQSVVVMIVEMMLRVARQDEERRGQR